LDAVFLYHAAVELGGGAVVLLSRGRLLVPGLPASGVFATDVLGCSIAVQGAAALFAWPHVAEPLVRQLALCFVAYNVAVIALVVARALALGARRSERAEAVTTAGALVVHSVGAAWFAAWLLHG
jgi:hypothetical protein